jgi:DNA-directed RNA polymerase subunit RPC12/RpoP
MYQATCSKCGKKILVPSELLDCLCPICRSPMTFIRLGCVSCED